MTLPNKPQDEQLGLSNSGEADSRELAGADDQLRERLLWVLSAATFLVFFQAYMVAPLIPRLSVVFGVSSHTIGLIVPAYMVPYGVSTLFCGLLSDRLGRLPIMLGSLAAFVVLTALTATSQSAEAMITWRLLTGLGASGVVPVGLALIGDLFPYQRRGRPLGWLFGAMAGGMAFGSTFGVVLEPFYGLSEVALGLALLGYGVPGLVFGPVIGRAADRWGRRWLIPTGLLLAAASAGALIANLPLIAAALMVTA